MKVYISGPISGEIPGTTREERKARFGLCETWILENKKDWTPVNPLNIGACDNGGECGDYDGHSWACWMRFDLKGLLECDGIVLLPGHTFSAGATLEAHVASTLGYEMFIATTEGVVLG